MNLKIISAAGNKRLILIFSGWGTDPAPFRRLSVEGYDIAVVWDYRTEIADTADIEGYEEIVVVGWSFGVVSATRFMKSNPRLPVTSTIAINGTTYPVDDQLGIPEAIFSGTLAGLSDDTLRKFYRRMSGSSDAFREFMAQPPERAIEELKEELKSIAARESVDGSRWDVAIVSENDRIIPAENQKRAWTLSGTRIISEPGHHLPDFQSLISSLLTNKPLVADRFRHAVRTYNDNAGVQLAVARKLVELWNPAPASKPDIIEIGCGTGLSTREILSRITPASLRLWDFNITDPPEGAECKECDAETEIMKTESESVDVIFSASTIQWFNSLPSFFRHASRALRRGGIIAVSTFGPDNFPELSAASHSHPTFPSLEAVRAMIPDTLTEIMVHEERLTLTFPSATHALRHISLTGVNALHAPLPAGQTRRILNSYPLTPDGKAELTYHPIYLILKKQ